MKLVSTRLRLSALSRCAFCGSVISIWQILSRPQLKLQINLTNEVLGILFDILSIVRARRRC